MDLLNVIKYFSKFPATTALQAMFANNRLGIAAYDTLKAEILTNPAQICPEITACIFTQDESKIEEIVREAPGLFLMLEYGPASIERPSAVGLRPANWSYTVIVGQMLDTQNSDTITELVLMDQALTTIKKIVAQIVADSENDDCHLASMGESAMSVSPLNPFQLYQAVGWALDITHMYKTGINGIG